MALHRTRLVALFLSTLAMALVAGLFYAFACSVMVGFARLDAPTFIRAMQAINDAVPNGAFAFSFFGALLFTAVAALLSLPRRRGGAAWLTVAALLVYAVGGFGVTVLCNVPLNEQLGAVRDLTTGDAEAVRRAFEGPWAQWNTVRTLASTVAFLLLATALYAVGREGREARPIAAPHDGTTVAGSVYRA